LFDCGIKLAEQQDRMSLAMSDQEKENGNNNDDGNDAILDEAR